MGKTILLIKDTKEKDRDGLQYNRLNSEDSRDFAINSGEGVSHRKSHEKETIRIVLLLVGLLFLSACLIVYFTTTMASSSPNEVTAEERELISKLSAGNVEFTKNLYSIVSREPGNVFCSPLSLELALLLAYNGATGNTSEEIKKVLSLPDSKEDVVKGAEALMKLFHNTQNVTLKIANGIYLHERFQVKDSYIDSTKKHFSAEAQRLDFAKSAEAAKTINGFVDKHTNHKITELFSPDAFNDLTRAVLVNAVYFLGNWSKRFKPEATYKGDFHLNSKSAVKTDFMVQTTHFEVSFNTEHNLTVVKLPYSGDEVSMVLLIPNEIEGLPELEAKIKDIDLVRLASRENLRRREVNLHLPKFKLEKTLNLESKLPELGLTAMFDANKATFKDISDEDLFVAKVIQKAYIEVDEKGTEAAAATGIMMVTYSMPRPPMEIKADRPFMFFLLQQSTGIPIFVGRLNTF